MGKVMGTIDGTRPNHLYWDLAQILVRGDAILGQLFVWFVHDILLHFHVVSERKVLGSILRGGFNSMSILLGLIGTNRRETLSNSYVNNNKSFV